MRDCAIRTVVEKKNGENKESDASFKFHCVENFVIVCWRHFSTGCFTVHVMLASFQRYVLWQIDRYIATAEQRSTNTTYRNNYFDFDLWGLCGVRLLHPLMCPAF